MPLRLQLCVAVCAAYVCISHATCGVPERSTLKSLRVNSKRRWATTIACPCLRRSLPLFASVRSLERSVDFGERRFGLSLMTYFSGAATAAGCSSPRAAALVPPISAARVA